MSAPNRRSVAVLRVLLGLAVASTTIHYGHNFVFAEDYPPVPLFFPSPLAYRIGIAVFYPLLTAVALWGVRQYRVGDVRTAVWALLAYAPLGLTSPGHYLGGVPDVPAFFTATIWTDFLTCALLVGFAAWAWRTYVAQPAATASRSAT